jgi:hypothetical protein
MRPAQYDKCHRLGGTLSDANPVAWGLFDVTDPSRAPRTSTASGAPLTLAL